MSLPSRYIRTVQGQPDQALDALTRCAQDLCRIERVSEGRYQLSPPVRDGSRNEPRTAVLVQVQHEDGGTSRVEAKFVAARLLPSQRWSWGSAWGALLVLNLLNVGLGWSFLVQQCAVTAVFALVYAYTLKSAKQSQDTDTRVLVDVLEKALRPLHLPPSYSSPRYRMSAPVPMRTRTV